MVNFNFSLKVSYSISRLTLIDFKISFSIKTLTKKITGNYGREIREIFQQIEDPDERARLRRARRAQMQRLRRKRIRDAAATSYPQNGSSLGSRRQSVDLESESASRSMASSPRDTPQPDLKLTAEEIKLEKQRADTRGNEEF